MTVVGVLLPLHIDGTLSLSKKISEPVAPVLLSVAILTCIMRWRSHRDVFFVWLGALLTTFFCRELHFAGTSAFVYIGFLALMFIAWHQYARMAGYFGGRIFMTLFSTTLLSYMIAVGLDNHWWKFLPGDKYQWAEVEEFVEITGHLMLLLLTALARPQPNPMTDTA